MKLISNYGPPFSSDFGQLCNRICTVPVGLRQMSGNLQYADSQTTYNKVVPGLQYINFQTVILYQMDVQKIIVIVCTF